MTKKERVEKLTKLMSEMEDGEYIILDVLNYHTLNYNSKDKVCFVVAFVGKSGYDYIDLPKLPSKDITAIYNSVKADYEL